MLEDIIIKPKNGGSKKANSGNFIAHQNFFEFIPKLGEKLIIFYNEIKYTIFQDGTKEMIILIHIHLKKPIKIGNKNSKDIQI